MNVFVTWIQNGDPITTILNFIKLPKSHLGQNMAQALVNTLNRYGIAHKVSTYGFRERNILIIDSDRINHV